MNGSVDVLVACRQKVRFLLQDCRCQRRYMHGEDWRGLMVPSAESPRYVLNQCQRLLLSLRRQRAARTLASIDGAV